MFFYIYQKSIFSCFFFIKEILKLIKNIKLIIIKFILAIFNFIKITKIRNFYSVKKIIT